VTLIPTLQVSNMKTIPAIFSFFDMGTVCRFCR
jgi:hypothetical protein